jgi:LmbE family N-acetylglucosaminyl deacetylase
VTAGLRGNAERFAATPLFGGGTPVTAWRSWDRPFPRLRLPECPALVLVAPHPDDETLGFGATAAMLRSRGVEVQVVSVSDGGGAYPILSSLQRSRLEHLRRDELHRATACLGLSRPLCLGLPDGKLAEAENDVVEVLTRLLTDRGPGTWCAATWRGDGHPDHEAVGRAAAAASVRAGAKLLEYPVWMWHWARPGDPDVPWHRMVRTALDRSAVARKQLAAQRFRSQLVGRAGVEPVLSPVVLQRLLAVGEVVITD